MGKCVSVGGIEKGKQIERRVCERYGTSQLCREGSTNKYVQFISKLDRKHCRMLVGLLTGQYQSAVHVAQYEKNKDFLMQEMRCSKGNVGTHSMRMPAGVGKGKDAGLGLCQNGSGTNKRSRDAENR